MDTENKKSQEDFLKTVESFAVHTIINQIRLLWSSPLPGQRILGVNLPESYHSFLKTQAHLFERLSTQNESPKKNMRLTPHPLPFPDQHFDRIICAIHESSSIQRLFYNLERLLKPEGELVLLVGRQSSAWKNLWCTKGTCAGQGKKVLREIENAFSHTSLTFVSKKPVLFSHPFLLKHTSWMCPWVESLGLWTNGLLYPSAAVLLYSQKRVLGHLTNLLKEPQIFEITQGVCAFKNHS